MVEAIRTQGAKAGARLSFFCWKMVQCPIFYWRVLRRTAMRLRFCWRGAHAAEVQRLIFLSCVGRGMTPARFYEIHAAGLDREKCFLHHQRIREFARDAGVAWDGEKGG